jgi:hypothetical protein
MRHGSQVVGKSGIGDVAPRAEMTLPIEFARVGEDAPGWLFDVLAAAVDPLEIAASLETCGLSNAVAHERFGAKDVFSLADKLFSAVAFKAVPLAKPRATRPGGVPDLGRGLVFATPTLMFAGAAIALHSWLSWWTVPLGLICGWAFGQFVAYAGFSQEGRPGPCGAEAAWGLGGAMVSCASLGVAGDLVLGGTYLGVIFAVAACAFMTAGAELVVHGEERLIGAVLAPGAIGSFVFITGEPIKIPVGVAVGVAVASIGATVLGALRHVPAFGTWASCIRRVDTATAARHFANGCCCGFFVALFMVLEPEKTGLPSWPGAAAYPLVLSLGAMEWQLRSLRSAARRALLGCSSVARFGTIVRRRLARSTVSYAAVVAVLTALVQALAHACGARVPVVLLTAAGCLALAFFLGLVVSSCRRVGLALCGWLAGLMTYGALAPLAHVAGLGAGVKGAEVALCIAASVPLAFLAVAAERVVANPVCHG